MKFNKGQKIWFADGGKRPFTVRESNERYTICTKPYNFKPETVIYTIIDFQRDIRGLDNMVFSLYDYYSDDSCAAAMKELINGTLEVSGRSNKHVDLDIIKVK